ncbi:MAG: hypothetical protein NC406_08135 [Bacteroides sp.]|nr:hypothetical protein [Bacteroides sp.]MCM1095821.1 hypothetical protein [Terasakiella sp.]
MAALGLMAAPLVGAQDTPASPLLTGKYRTEAVFAKYPRLKPTLTANNKNSSTFEIYVLRGDALDNYNATVEDDNAKLPDLADHPSLHTGLSYRIKTVDPLFARGGALYTGSKNFEKLARARGSVADKPYLAKGGEPVELDFRFGSTEKRIRLGYFYVTPAMAEALRIKVAERWEAVKDIKLEPWQELDDPFDNLIYSVRTGRYEDVEYRYNPVLARLDDYELGLFAAFSAQLIPAFSVASDLVNRGYITVQAPDDNPDLDLSGISGNNNLGHVWTSYEKYTKVCESTVTGSKFRLTYFGEDYLGEPVSEFPEDTQIYPFIIANENDKGEIEPVDDDGYITLKASVGDVRMMVSRLNSFGPATGGRFPDEAEWDEARQKYLAQPNAFSFPYTYVAYDGTVRSLNLTAFEDQGGAAAGGHNYADIIFDVQGVKPISEVAYSTNDMSIAVSPVGEVADESNHYYHRLSLSASEGKGLQSRRLGLLEIKGDGYSVPFTTKPAFSIMNILRADCGDEPVAYVLFKKYFTDESFEKYKTEKNLLLLDAQIDYKVYTAAEFARINDADGTHFEMVEDWMPLQEPYHFYLNDNGIFQNSVVVELENIAGLHDDFESEVNTDDEEYEYSAYLVGYSGYVMRSVNKDRVVIPKSEVLVERGGDIEFVAGQNCDELPVETGDGGAEYVSVKVATDPLMYIKERVVSYSVVDASGAEVCTLSRGDDGAWTATGGATVLGYNPGEGRYGWVVLELPAAQSVSRSAADSRGYTVNINTEPLEAVLAAADTDAAGNSYGAPRAEAPGADDLLTFVVTANEKAYANYGIISYGVRTDWSLDASVDPEGVLFNQWRTYDHMYDTAAEGKYGNILRGLDASTGTIEPDFYAGTLALHFPAHGGNSLISDGGSFSNLDVLNQTFDFDTPRDAEVNATYTLRAYIPAKDPVHLAGARRAARRAADDAPVRYYMVEQTADLHHTASERDDSLTGILDITSPDADAPVEYYNLQGVRVAEPAPGQVVIRRQGSSAVKTVIQ